MAVEDDLAVRHAVAREHAHRADAQRLVVDPARRQRRMTSRNPREQVAEGALAERVVTADATSR